MKDFSSLEDINFVFLILLSFISKTPLIYKFNRNSDDNKVILNLFKEFSKDSSYTINDNVLSFYPGKLNGGKFSYKIKNISKIILPIIIFGLFSRDGITIELEGITNQSSILLDNEKKSRIEAFSIDIIKIIFGKICKMIDINVNIEVSKRGFDPMGEGIVKIKVDRIREIKNILLKENVSFYKIRGLVVTSKISADFTHRMINKMRNILNEFNNVKISNILNNRRDSGPSPGYECSLYAESKIGIISSTVNNHKNPELMAEDCCRYLFKNIENGNIFNSEINRFLIILMSLSKNISYLRFTKFDLYTKELLRFVKELFNIEYFIDKDDNGFILKIIGSNYRNSAIYVN